MTSRSDLLEQLAKDLSARIKHTPSGMPDCVWEGLVANALDGMYQARTAFKDDIGHAITILVAVIGGGVYVATKALEDLAELASRPSTREVVQACAPSLVLILIAILVLCGAVPVLAGSFAGKLTSGYGIYASALIHANVVFKALGVTNITHHWVQDLEQCADKRGFFEDPDHNANPNSTYRNPRFQASTSEGSVTPKSTEQLISVMFATKPNLYARYTTTLRVVKWSSIVIGVVSVAVYVWLFNSKLHP